MVELPQEEITLPSLARYEMDVDQRLAILRSENCRVVFLYEARDFGSFRYRCYAPAQILDKAAPGIATWFFQEEIPLFENALAGIKRLVLARMPWSNSLERLMCRAAADGLEMVFDTDDLVFDSRYSPLICNILRTRNRIEVDYWFAYVARRFAVAHRCSRFLSTNSFLDERIREVFPDRESRVSPNFPTFEQFEASSAIRRLKESRSAADPFLVGYFSGSATHNDDFGMICEELLSWMGSNPRVGLRVVGHLDLPRRFDDLRRQGRVECLPATDFLELQRLIGECDVNLAPLVPGVFADCKSELKFFDAALVGTPTIASPTHAFRQVIDDGRNGVLCQAGSWARSLRSIYESGPEKRREVACSALEDVLRDYAGPAFEERIWSCYGAGLSAAAGRAGP